MNDMTNIAERFTYGVINTLIYTPFAAAGSALFGYIYAKFADLPAGHVAKAMAIWAIVESSIMIIGCSFSEDAQIQRLIPGLVVVLGTGIGIQELQKETSLARKWSWSSFQ